MPRRRTGVAQCRLPQTPEGRRISRADDSSRLRGRDGSPRGRSRRNRANRLAAACDPQGQGLVQSESLATGMPNLRILVQDRQLRSEVIIGSRKYVPVRLVQLQPSLENDVLDIGENPLRRKKPVCI